MNDLLKIDYERHRLDNGLDVILYPKKGIPVVSLNIWYRVGSANEIYGKTGFAHLFEHMMFQGSANVPKEKHFNYIQEAGGTLNGSTSIDRTNYYESVPSNFLEMVLWLESDRMGFMLDGLTQDKLDNQKSVVMNERRERYDNQPYGRAFETLFSNLYPEGHPYHWPTIGWMEDIEKFELNDVKQFFADYYTPDNASLVLTGDFETSNALALVKSYFGEIKPSGKEHTVSIPAFEHEKDINVVLEDDVQLSRIYIAWHSCKAYHEDDAMLDVLADQLGGSKNARLYKTLVHEKRLTLDVSVFQYSGKYDGSFIIAATAIPGADIDEIKRIILEELNNIADSGITEEELIRSKNSIKSSFIYSIQNLDTISDHLNHYNFYLGEPDSFNTDIARYEKATSGRVADVCKKYLSSGHVDLRIIPRNSK